MFYGFVLMHLNKLIIIGLPEFSDYCSSRVNLEYFVVLEGCC